MESSYKQLHVWQRAIELVGEIYNLTKQLPASEEFGLKSQMRRCVVSIPSNIAEGYKRRNRGEYLHFLSIAESSAAELETQITIVKANYPSTEFSKADGLLIEIQKMLYVLIKKLSQRTPTL